jgi:hypothetical protein
MGKSGEASVEHWLVRTAENVIAGPYSKEQICELIREGELTLPDEVCPANRHWFFLHEREEVARSLGVEMSDHLVEPDDEPTHTQTETETNLEALRMAETAAAAIGSEGQTGVIRMPERVHLNRQLSTQATPVGSAQARAVHVVSASTESGSLGRAVVALIGLVMAVLALFWVLRARRPVVPATPPALEQTLPTQPSDPNAPAPMPAPIPPGSP